MDTLKSLLGKAGVSNELAAAICEEIDRLSDSIKKQHDAAFRERLEKAKKVCLEELAKEKSSLARKVKVYLESKARSFEESAERARKIEEAESATKIRRALDILTDGQVSNADSDLNGQLVAAQKLNARLEKALAGLKEQRDLAVARAQRAFGIAENALARSRNVEAVSEANKKNKEMPDFIKAKMNQNGKGGEGPKGKLPKAKAMGAACEDATTKPTLDESRRFAARSRAASPILESNQKLGARRPIGESQNKGDNQISEIAQAIPELE